MTDVKKLEELTKADSHVKGIYEAVFEKANPKCDGYYDSVYVDDDYYTEQEIAEVVKSLEDCGLVVDAVPFVNEGHYVFDIWYVFK